MWILYYLQSEGIIVVAVVKTLFFKAILDLQQHWGGEGTEISHTSSCPTHAQPLPLSTPLTTLTHYYHPESRVYIRIHFWHCSFCEFEPMCKCIYPSLQYHTEYFHCLESLLSFAYSSLPPPQPLTTTDLFTSSLICLFQNVT